MNNIILVSGGLSTGGSERVIAELANNICIKKDYAVHIILLTDGEIFYKIDKKVLIHRPCFDIKSYGRIVFIYKIFFFLRNKIKKIKPDAILTFGRKYNSFVILASIRLNTKVYISERSQPDISSGYFLDNLNTIVYRKAKGIIAQTELAKKILHKKTGHSNIKVIGNPIPNLFNPSVKKEKIILNVGRFIKSKKQDLLIDIFHQINPEEWELWFLGDGKRLDFCKKKVVVLGMKDKIKFFGNQTDIERFYQKASIFAFTSISEGFPNALGEAMAAGSACISFDCIAGPSDLIDDGYNGYLVPMSATSTYSGKLRKLIMDDEIARRLGENSVQKMKEFDKHIISNKYLKFILSDFSTNKQ